MTSRLTCGGSSRPRSVRLINGAIVRDWQSLTIILGIGIGIGIGIGRLFSMLLSMTDNL